MGEARMEHEESEEEESSTEKVGAGIGYGDYAHLGGEAIKEGGVAGEGSGWMSLGKEMVEDGSKVMEEGSMGEQLWSFGATPLAGAVGLVGGGFEIADGVEQMRRGDYAGGAISELGGAASIGSGVSTFAGLAGSSTLAPAAPALAAGAAGLKLGHYGDGQVKELGWLQDDQGNNEAASGWAAQQSGHVDDWVAKHTHSATLGKIAGVGSMIGTVPAAAALAVAGAATTGAKKVGGLADSGYHALTGAGTTIGAELANQHRANGYAGTSASDPLSSVDQISGHDPVTGALMTATRGTPQAEAIGKQMANYDDGAEAAVARSKLLHPERWGQQENAVSAFDKVAQKMAAGTHPGRTTPAG